MKKKVAILGAGFSGLGAIKSCLEEDLEPTCFEQYESIGGVWYYTDEYREGQGASVFDSVTTNGSKDMMPFSDFPCPHEMPPFLYHRDVLEYQKLYVQKFGLEKYIHLNTKVTKVTRSRDYDVNGTWEVETVTNNGSPTRHVFDFVMVCSGFYKKPFTPDIKGMESFKGDIQHSATYRNGEKYKNKRVLVVGNGNSSGDMAAGIAPFATKVFYSVGPGIWIMPRFNKRGIPFDLSLFQRPNFKNQDRLNAILYDICENRLDVQRAGCFPPTSPIMSRFCINDEVQNFIMNGKIKIHSRLVRLGPREAEFDDGSVVHDVDAVLFATGYKLSLDFLEEPIIDENDKLSLYKMVFPVHLPHHTMALIGCQEVIGSNPTIQELQARLAVRVFVGKKKLPLKEKMAKDIDRWNQIILQMNGRYRYLFGYFPFHDDLASELGVTPSWLDLIKAGPWLAYNYLYGTAFPYQDRLWGPHSWSGAKEAIAYALEHGTYAKQPRKNTPPKNLSKSSNKLTGLLFLSVAAVSLAVAFKYFRR